MIRDTCSVGQIIPSKNGFFTATAWLCSNGTAQAIPIVARHLAIHSAGWHIMVVRYNHTPCNEIVCLDARLPI